MLILGIVGLIGCGASTQELTALRQENQALKERIAELEAEDGEPDSSADREERMAYLQDRLAQRRARRSSHTTDDTDGEPGTGNGLADDVATLRETLADPERSASLGRALMHRGPDGAIDGYRISAIRRGSILDRVGLRNGDILHSVNGHQLTSMSAVMEAYNTLTPQTQSLKVVLTRRGRPVTLDLSLD